MAGERSSTACPNPQPLGARAGDCRPRPPVPTAVTQYIPSGSDEAAWFTSFYLQDQWTLNRFTFNGALRYDNAQSHFGKTCVGPDLYKPDPVLPERPGARATGKGVYFQDITPRWGVAWDVFGNGKTSIKYSMGKYLQGAQVGGIYTATNPAAAAARSTRMAQNWRDLDGDRIVDCDLTIPAVAPADRRSAAERRMRRPAGLEAPRAANRAPLRPQSRRPRRSRPGDRPRHDLLRTGRDRSMSQAIRNYCNNYFAAGGSSLLEGWDKRRVRMAVVDRRPARDPAAAVGEVTYNRRVSGNQTVSDLIGVGLRSLQRGSTAARSTRSSAWRTC